MITFNHSKLGSLLINSAFLNFLQTSWLIKVWCSWEPCYDEEKSKVQRKETADANLHLTESPKDWISWKYYDFFDQQIKLKHLGPTTLHQKKAVVQMGVFLLFRFLYFMPFLLSIKPINPGHGESEPHWPISEMIWDTVDGWNPANHRLDGIKNPENNGEKNFQPQLVIAGFLNHQQYVIDFCVFEVPHQSAVHNQRYDYSKKHLRMNSGWSRGLIFVSRIFWGFCFCSLKTWRHWNSTLSTRNKTTTIQTKQKNSISSWWFQPIPKILVKLDHFPR